MRQEGARSKVGVSEGPGARIVRIFNQRWQQIAMHVRHEQGRFSTHTEHLAKEKISGVERGAAWLLGKIHGIGEQALAWAEAMLQARGIEGVRVLQGLLTLAKTNSCEALNEAALLQCVPTPDAARIAQAARRSPTTTAVSRRASLDPPAIACEINRLQHQRVRTSQKGPMRPPARCRRSGAKRLPQRPAPPVLKPTRLAKRNDFSDYQPAFPGSF